MIKRNAVVRELNGPFVRRLCLAEDSGFAWVEMYLTPGSYLDSGQIESLATVLGHPPPLAFPVVEHCMAVWPLQPTSRLLCDILPQSGSALRVQLRDLGSVLQLIHSVDCPLPDLSDLPERRWPAWFDSPEWRNRIRSARNSLPVDEAGSLAVLAAEIPDGDSATFGLVHGRFSLGVCTAADPIRLMGWREAGWGDQMQDLAFLLGELVEASAALGTSTKALRSQLASLFEGYWEGNARLDRRRALKRLPALVAGRILDHQAQAVLAFGQADDREALLARASAHLDVLGEFLS